MSYIDGCVLPVPKKKLNMYKKMAAGAGKIWRKHGALAYIEAIGDDLKGQKGLAKFPKVIKAKPGETVVFAYVVYKPRKHRDQVNAKVFKDPAMNEDQWKDKPMPFDMKRMAYGGFKVIVDA